MYYDYYDQVFWHHGPTAGLIATLLYFLPTVIAFLRGHHSRIGILVLNFFLGWSGLGWIIALIWALSPVRHYYWLAEWGPPPGSRGR